MKIAQIQTPINTLQDAINEANKNNWELVEKQTRAPSIDDVKSEVKKVVTNIFKITENIDAVVNILMGQINMETGFKSVNNNNVGNIRAYGSANQYWKGKVFPILTNDYNKKNGKYQVFKHYALFRHYDTLNEGVSDWARLLNKRFPNAVAKAVEGDARGFVYELKKNNYFTDDPEHYLTGVESWKNKQKATTIKNPTPQSKSPNYDQMISKLINKENITPNLENLLDNLLMAVRASEKDHKNLYKKYLPLNNFVIKISSNDIINSIEFGRILCAALDEELLSNSYIHIDDDKVEIQCDINGSKELCAKAIQQLTNSVKNAFMEATVKLGKININTDLLINKKSSYSGITLSASLTNYRKFLLKFAEAK